MIKTVSFAPPRAASSRSAGKPPSAPRKTSSRAASGSPSPQISLEFSALESAPVEVTPTKTKLPKVVEAKTAEVQAAPVPAKAIAKTAPVKAAKEPSPKAKAAKVAKTEPAPLQAAVTEAAHKATTTKKEAPKLKGKRVYAPKDLAAQYGEKVVERPVTAPALETIAPKKRLNKEEREARRQLIKPDEGLRERLARATQITFTKPKGEPRGKGWKFECGRCGATSYFQTPGGVCACGTIAVKELV